MPERSEGGARRAPRGLHRERRRAARGPDHDLPRGHDGPAAVRHAAADGALPERRGRSRRPRPACRTRSGRRRRDPSCSAGGRSAGPAETSRLSVISSAVVGRSGLIVRTGTPGAAVAGAAAVAHAATAHTSTPRTTARIPSPYPGRRRAGAAIAGRSGRRWPVRAATAPRPIMHAAADAVQPPAGGGGAAEALGGRPGEQRVRRVADHRDDDEDEPEPDDLQARAPRRPGR